ncbi:DUF1800 domain-containing protein [Oceanobacter mangrovi]|uniref:DUF1800 domain-containing protein n=1 Tax=Oceanobacter mangrovi TaxID=2862510 RepID=UPI001C8EC278|nr:DUF1800 domain-containing protein [Oceanobacter mangrovi]
MATLLRPVTLLVTLAISVNSWAETICASPEYRLATQASFGATPDLLAAIRAEGQQGWIDQQLAMPVSGSQLNRTIELALKIEPDINWFGKNGFNPDAIARVQNFQSSAWWQAALASPGQLRQRVAFALSQIWVTSIYEPPLQNRSEALAQYQDLLLSHAFGNYRDLMEAVSLSPTMGVYLSHQGNKPGNPDENYARELMQLFTLGINQLNPDGTPVMVNGQPVATYSQDDVMELARVLTGWDLVGNHRYGARNKLQGTYLVPMEFTPEQHDSDSKTLLGQQIPAGLTGKEDLQKALDIIFSQPSLPPFVSRQLIQKLVTSNPSAAYVKRVSSVFVDNGSGVRGDMKAVIRTILLDPEARGKEPDSVPAHLREPVLWMSGVLRYLNVEPADQFQWRNGPLLTGIYWFKQLGVGQDPYRSPSVFNFYEPNYQPAEQYFGDHDLVAPESSLMTGESLIKLDQRLTDAFAYMDKSGLDVLPENQLAQARLKRNRTAFNISIDSMPLMHQLEIALDGDASGDFHYLQQVTRPLKAAQRDYLTDALGKFVDQVAVDLTGCSLGDDTRTEVVSALIYMWGKDPAAGKNKAEKDKHGKGKKLSPLEASQQAHDWVASTVRLVAMSPQYWVMH